jgi:glucose-1-phosphatase
MPSTPKKANIKAVLFDAGKVILHFNFDPAFKRLARHARVTPKEIEDFFVASGLEVLYDGGKITSLHFYREVKKALGLRMTYEAFRRAWCAIFTPKNDVIALVRELKKKGYRLVLVSNTNDMHFRHEFGKYPVFRLFDKLVLSFKEKCRKPDPRIYRVAAKACRAKPREIFYIDDRADLTEAARELGFHTFTYKNDIVRLRAEMKKLGIL